MKREIEGAVLGKKRIAARIEVQNIGVVVVTKNTDVILPHGFWDRGLAAANTRAGGPIQHVGVVTDRHAACLKPLLPGDVSDVSVGVATHHSELVLRAGYGKPLKPHGHEALEPARTIAILGNRSGNKQLTGLKGDVENFDVSVA